MSSHILGKMPRTYIIVLGTKLHSCIAWTAKNMFTDFKVPAQHTHSSLPFTFFTVIEKETCYALCNSTACGVWYQITVFEYFCLCYIKTKHRNMLIQSVICKSVSRIFTLSVWFISENRPPLGAAVLVWQFLSQTSPLWLLVCIFFSKCLKG